MNYFLNQSKAIIMINESCVEVQSVATRAFDLHEEKHSFTKKPNTTPEIFFLMFSCNKGFKV